jgi:hypothetical protein
MEQTYEKIKALYNTVLGRFSAFRQFIDVLWGFAAQIASQNAAIDGMAAKIVNMEIQIEAQHELIQSAIKAVQELAEKTSPPKTSPDFRTAAQIMEERFQSYQERYNVNA